MSSFYLNLSKLNIKEYFNWREILFQLKTSVLNATRLDFLTFYCKNMFIANEFIVQIKQFESPRVFRYSRLNGVLQNSEKYSDKEIDMIKCFHLDSSNDSIALGNIKQKRLGYQIVVSEDIYMKRKWLFFRVLRYSHCHVRICGEFSETVFQLLMKKKLKICFEKLKITRLDVYLDLFKYVSFDCNIREFLDFLALVQHHFFLRNSCPSTVRAYTNQDNESCKKKKNRFQVVYVNKRTSRWMTRVYLSEKLEKLTFEIEFSKESVTRFREVIANQDYYGYNKLLVLELDYIYNQVFKSINCEFLNPLKMWYSTYILVLRKSFFAYDNLFLREKKTEVLGAITVFEPLITLDDIKLFNPNNYFVGLKLFQALSDLDLEKNLFSKFFLVLSFINNKILQKEKSNVRSFVFNEDFIKNPLNQIEIEIYLEELANFLQLNYCTYTRKVLIDLIEQLCLQKITIITDQIFYFNNVIKISSTKLVKGKKASLILLINPIIISDLLSKTIWFKYKVYKIFFDELKKDAKKNKKISENNYSVFVFSLSGLFIRQDYLFKQLILLKDTKHPNRRQKLSENFFKLLFLFEKNMQLSVGMIKINEQLEVFTKCSVEPFFLSSNLKKLSQLIFFCDLDPEIGED